MAIQSTVVLLTGREKPWPEVRTYRTSPKGRSFSGVRFRVDAVYQRTVKELMERQSLLWLVFAPLAVDADAKQLRRVVKSIESKASDERTFSEITGAMTAIADVDGRHRNLRQELLSYLPEEVVMQSWIYKEGEARGLRVAIADICSLLNIPIGANELTLLGSLDVESLERLRQVLKTERRWPDSFRTSV